MNAGMRCGSPPSSCQTNNVSGVGPRSSRCLRRIWQSAHWFWYARRRTRSTCSRNAWRWWMRCGLKLRRKAPACRRHLSASGQPRVPISWIATVAGGTNVSKCCQHGLRHRRAGGRKGESGRIVCDDPRPPAAGRIPAPSREIACIGTSPEEADMSMSSGILTSLHELTDGRRQRRKHPDDSARGTPYLRLIEPEP